jgi:ureidoacrylate peracid hydrolase
MENKRSDAPSESDTYLPKDESGISYPPEHTALLLIDPVNDFLSEGGPVGN